jgi:hypothetical protein
VDDILVIFDSDHTNIQTILDDFNAVHPKLKFTAEMESQHNKLLGHHYPQNPHQLEDIHLQETHVHRHHYPMHIKPPHSAQIRCSEVPL